MAHRCKSLNFLKTSMSRILAIIPAAGCGSRMNSCVPKQYLKFGQNTMLELTAGKLARVLGPERVFIGVSAGDAYVGELDLKNMHVLRTGGTTRAETVSNTLEAAMQYGAVSANDLVLVHDAARPLVEEADIEKLIAESKKQIAAGTASGCVLAIAVVDTVKRTDEQGYLSEDIDRKGLYRIATPQCFRAGELAQALSENPDVTDESSAIRLSGGRVAVVDCDPANIKVTQPADADFVCERLLKESHMQMRVGYGYDSHRLEPGRKFILGGVEIEHSLGLAGHSDADALLHAITDALLGAANCGNIGILFPDNDPAFKGADSKVLLKKAWDAVAQKGWRIANIDCVVIAQKPKLNPHVPAMARTIASILNIDPDQVSVKPKTNEKLGFEGKEEGISTRAVVLLTKSC